MQSVKCINWRQNIPNGLRKKFSLLKNLKVKFFVIVLEQIYVAFIWMLFNSNSTSNLSNINEHARNKRILQDH